MAVNDFTIAETKSGARIHRATCTRQRNSSPLGKAIDFAPGTVLTATIASCCKPKAALVYIEGLGDSATVEDVAPEVTSDEDGLEADVEEEPRDVLSEIESVLFTTDENEEAVLSAETMAKVTGSTSATVVHDHREADGTLVTDSVTVGPDYTGVSKHYHSALRKTDATQDEALAAFAALKVWRRSDTEYKALPPQDSKWATSERYAWERDFLIGYMAGVAGTDYTSTYASTEVPTSHGHSAWVADYNAADLEDVL